MMNKDWPRSRGGMSASPPLWFGLNISAITGWIAVKVCTDIHNAQMINHNNFGDPLTFHLAPP